jgi:hypothetical protein
MTSLTSTLVVVAALASTALSAQTKPNVVTPVERKEGWQLLFDGHTLKGWHALGFATMPAGLWTVESGAIKHLVKTKGALQPDGQPLVGFDLISDSSYQNFELSWSWKISRAGNSGLKYNVSEELSTSMSPPHAAKGWEYQMIDDAKNEDNKLATHRSGALYDMFAPNAKKRVKPAGQWNRSRLVFRGNHGEHWLNGVKVVDYELWTPDWERRVRESKFKDYPKYGRASRGHIGLQDHGDQAAFRNIKIRELK